jgi:hypothetical protein
MILTSNPDAVITFTVDNYVSVMQRKMLTAGMSPDVTATLVSDSSGRVTRVSNGSFTVSGSAPGGNHLVFRLEVLPAGDYEIKGVIIKNLSNTNEGGVAWDQVIIGSGANDNKVTLRDIGKKPSGVTSIEYQLCLLIKPKQDPEWYPVGDFGLIDPLWTNN